MSNWRSVSYCHHDKRDKFSYWHPRLWAETFPTDGIPRVDLRGLEVWQQAEEIAGSLDRAFLLVMKNRREDTVSCIFLRHTSLDRLVAAVKRNTKLKIVLDGWNDEGYYLAT